MPEKTTAVRESKSKTMAILIKLLATKIVARSFLGFESSFLIIRSFLEGLVSSSSTSTAFNEKKATSAPEIKAEQNSNTNRITILVIAVTLKIALKSKLGGSISKTFDLMNVKREQCHSPHLSLVALALALSHLKQLEHSLQHQ